MYYREQHKCYAWLASCNWSTEFHTYGLSNGISIKSRLVNQRYKLCNKDRGFDQHVPVDEQLYDAGLVHMA